MQFVGLEIIGFLLFWTYVAKRTTFGRHVYAVGGNAEAARRAGIKPAHLSRRQIVQQMLTEAGKHRSAGPVDLLIAAAAEQQHLTVLSDDRDFEVVASVTRQRVRLVTDI